MLKDILKKTYIIFNKVKVIHSIPGRIRLFIPNLEKIPNHMKKYENYIDSILKLKRGIKKIEYSYLTSKILIEYDKEILSEKDVVEWLNKIWKIIIENENLYYGMTVKEIEKNIENFYFMLKEKIEKEG